MSTEAEETKVSILAVDDDPAVCALLKDSLSAQGYACEICPSGEKALEMLSQAAVDLVISDVKMPGISGLDLLRDVVHNHSRAAFIMVTGVDDLQVAIDAMKQGADDYLVKPFALDVLQMSVERALNKKRMQLELEQYRRSLEDMVEQRTKQLQAAMKRIELTYDETLEALGAALDLRDNETGGHSRRVSLCCLAMARVMGLPAAQLKNIARGSYLHDIGKIGIPDAILLKPGKLTPEEREVMESHVRIGYDLVCHIGFLAGAAEIVLAHQERFDGTGYPQGLVGDEIPIGARIFAVADTLDAMTSDRSYRKALSFAAAKAEIKRESGRQFDPKVVAAFLSLPETTWQEIREQAVTPRLISAGSQAGKLDLPLAA